MRTHVQPPALNAPQGHADNYSRTPGAVGGPGFPHGDTVSFTKLDSNLPMSSVWAADDATLRLWIALLSQADAHGFVAGTVPGMARLCGKPIEEIERSLTILEGPDPHSRTPDNEGRRLARVDGGWVLLNHAKYRERTDRDKRRAQVRDAVRAWRERRGGPKKPTAPAVKVEAAMSFPVVGKGEWLLTAEKVAEWEESFPSMDVIAECRKARQWLLDNPDRRKTERGMPRFLGSWLARAQNSGKYERRSAPFTKPQPPAAPRRSAIALDHAPRWRAVLEHMNHAGSFPVLDVLEDTAERIVLRAGDARSVHNIEDVFRSDLNAAAREAFGDGAPEILVTT